jgi:hypothetical protein
MFRYSRFLYGQWVHLHQGKEMDSRYVALEDFVRSIKGAPASVLWILSLTRGYFSLQALQQATGYSRKPVKAALTWLEAREYVAFQPDRGWCLGPSFQRLGSSFKQPSTDQRPFSAAAGEDAVPLDPHQPADRRKVSPPDLDLGCLIDPPSPGTVNQPIKQTTMAGSGIPPEGNALARLLAHAGIRGRPLAQLQARADLDEAVVLAWHWHCLTLPWLQNPPGYLICRLKDGHSPPDTFLRLAQAWRKMDPQDRQQLLAAASGNDRGRRLHAGATDGRDLRYLLGDDFWPELDTGCLEAYQQLLLSAPQEARDDQLESNQPTSVTWQRRM